MHSKLIAAFLALALAAPAMAADEPGVFKVPGTDSTIKFYGYAQFDTTLDFSGRADGYENSDWASVLPAVPNDKSPQAKRVTPQLYFTTRTSRFGIQTNTPSAAGNIGVRLEGDFNAPNGFQSETFTNSVLFRLRHAYGTIGGLLVGQTWTTFIDLGAAPDTVDFNGPGTLALVRNPMIRYTFGLAPGANLALAVENTRGPQFSDNAGGNADPRFQTLPDIHANFTFNQPWGHISVRGVGQTYNRAVLAGGQYADVSAKSTVSVAGAVSGSVKIGGDTLVAQFAGGPGIGRYMLNSIGAPWVSTNANGNLDLWTVYGVHAGYTHVWSPVVRSNLVGAYTWIQDAKINGVDSTNANEKSMVQLFVNTFWGFAKNCEFGVEYAYGQWTSFSTPASPELKGTQNRVNASFHYNFF